MTDVVAESHPKHVPHFDVRALDGQLVRYQELWQRRNLVLVLGAPDQRDAARRYASTLQSHHREFEETETTVVVTTDPVRGLPVPAVIVADRWGEIVHIETTTAAEPSRFPDVQEILAWIQFVRIQCPECPP